MAIVQTESHRAYLMCQYVNLNGLFCVICYEKAFIGIKILRNPLEV